MYASSVIDNSRKGTYSFIFNDKNFIIYGTQKPGLFQEASLIRAGLWEFGTTRCTLRALLIIQGKVHTASYLMIKVNESQAFLSRSLPN